MGKVVTKLLRSAKIIDNAKWSLSFYLGDFPSKRLQYLLCSGIVQSVLAFCSPLACDYACWVELVQLLADPDVTGACQPLQ